MQNNDLWHAGMQPYFFPYIGYWQLISAVDKFVIYDDGKMIVNGWIHRNRILSESKSDAQDIAIPVLHKSANYLINEMQLMDDSEKFNKIMRIIKMRYQKTPYYSEIIALIEPLILHNERNMAKYLAHSIIALCEYLDIPTEIIVSSSIDKSGLNTFEEKLVRICDSLQVHNWLNAIGGMQMYDKQHFADLGIRLQFIKTNDIVYEQIGKSFVPNLSIIDVLMHNGKEGTKQLLKEYTLI